MRAVLQRVSQAQVRVSGDVVGQIGAGLVVLLGVTHDDTEAEVAWLANKVATVRVMAEEKSLLDISGAALVISQFTLYGDARKGRRPTWQHAAPGTVSEPLYDAFCRKLADSGVPVQTGIFGAEMAVSLINEGPITLILDTTAVSVGNKVT